MPLEQTGVEFISKGFDEFIRNIGEASKTIASLGRMTENRLQALRELNNILATGSDAFKKYSQNVSQSTQQVEDSLSGLQATATSAVGIMAMAGDKMGGIFKGVAAAGGLGGIVGSAVGTLAGPGIGNVMGAAIGTLAGMWAKLQANIFKAIGQFLPKTVAKIANAGLQIGKSLWDFSKSIINVAKAIASPIINAIKSIFSAIVGLFTGGGGGIVRVGGWRSLGDTIFSAMFKFEILKQVIRRIIQEIKTFASEAFNAAVELQTLTARIDNLIAMQIRNADATKNYASSLRMAIPYTQELVKWIQKLALTTPVSLEDISEVTYLSLAMGWTVDKAKTLTKAIIDYTAALGMGSEISERIIYNFAQMRQQGKVTGTELRDLGRGAFMPINKILEMMWKNMGETTKSFQQFRDEASAGAIPVEKFFDAFIQFVNVNMPDMAYKMNYTFKAVFQNLHDLFKTLVGWNVLGPMIRSLTEPVQNFINSFKTDEMMVKANAVGKAIAFIIETVRTGSFWITNALKKIAEALQLPRLSIESVIKSLIKLGLLIYKIERFVGSLLQKLIPVATQIGDKLGSAFDKMGDDFFSYGVNLVFNFASGMMQAAAKFLTVAIKAIARLLTSWFSPGSPPAIAPEIDLWGMETINEWLHGFMQADFDILGDLQSSLKSSLDALVAFGVFTDEQSNKAYARMSYGLIQAMDELNRTGNITIDVFKELRNIGGVYGKEISELMDLQMQHLIILKAYNDAVKKRERLEVSTNKLIRNYNMMLRKGADKSVLKNKLKVVNASEMELDVARKAELEKKRQLDTIEEQVKLQESLIKALVDFAQAQKDAMGGAAGSVEELTEAIEDMGAGLGSLGEEGFKIDFEALKKQAEEEFRNLFKNLGDQWKQTLWDNFKSPDSEFQKALGGLEVAWSGTISKLKRAWDVFAKSVGLPSIDEIVSAWNAPSSVTMPMPSGASIYAPQTITTGQPTLLDRFKSVIQTFSDAIKADGGILALLGNIAGYVWDKLIEYLNAPRTIVVGGAGRPVRYVQDPSRFQEFLDGVKKSLLVAIDSIDWTPILAKIGAKILIGVYKIPSWQQIGGAIVKAIWDGIIVDGITWLGTKTGELLQKFITWLNDVFDIGSPAKKIIPIGESIIEGMYNGLKSGVTGLWETAKSAFQLFIDKVKDFFGIGSNDPATNPFVNIGNAIVQGIVNGINAFKGKILEAIQSLGIDMPLWLRKLLEASSPSMVFYDIGKDMMLGIREGIKGSSKMVKKTMLGAVGNYAMSPLMRMNAPMQASPVYGGATVNFGDVNINNGMDWAVFKAQVQRAIVEG